MRGPSGVLPVNDCSAVRLRMKSILAAYRNREVESLICNKDPAVGIEPGDQDKCKERQQRRQSWHSSPQGNRTVTIRCHADIVVSCNRIVAINWLNPTGKVTDKEVELDYYLDVPKTQSAAPSGSVVMDQALWTASWGFLPISLSLLVLYIWFMVKSLTLRSRYRDNKKEHGTTKKKSFKGSLSFCITAEVQSARRADRGGAGIQILNPNATHTERKDRYEDDQTESL
ncbi:hypothetical protein EYF80_028999 [Liparis tanakae]|uniref:Uncharacterized protein n=1 Tax=Liparis tanakae TaxID=230148 RepID=A0A4Z2H681_9TELE|nr:hypothetical protein EYF80_028999 [Liparis tanakae]